MPDEEREAPSSSAGSLVKTEDAHLAEPVAPEAAAAGGGGAGAAAEGGGGGGGGGGQAAGGPGGGGRGAEGKGGGTAAEAEGSEGQLHCKRHSRNWRCKNLAGTNTRGYCDTHYGMISARKIAKRIATAGAHRAAEGAGAAAAGGATASAGGGGGAPSPALAGGEAGLSGTEGQFRCKEMHLNGQRENDAEGSNSKSVSNKQSDDERQCRRDSSIRASAAPGQSSRIPVAIKIERNDETDT